MLWFVGSCMMVDLLPKWKSVSESTFLSAHKMCCGNSIQSPLLPLCCLLGDFHNARAKLLSRALAASIRHFAGFRIQQRRKCDITQLLPSWFPLISMWSLTLDFYNSVINTTDCYWGSKNLLRGFDPLDTSFSSKGASRHLEASYRGFMELWT